jgi:DNA-binding NarL/FixJ family response regulator
MIRILIALPSRLICDSLRATLEEHDEVYVVGCATTAEEFRFLLPYSNAVLLGAQLKDCTAIDLLREIQCTHASTSVLVMGIEEEPDLIIRYLEAGASGYILQNDSLEKMVDKLRAVQTDEAIVSPTIAAAMIQRLNRLANMEMPLSFVESRRTQLDELTAREYEVLTLINNGSTNRDIASELVIEYGTVKNHVHNILAKLEVRSRHEAASIFRMEQQPAMAAL